MLTSLSAAPRAAWAARGWRVPRCAQQLLAAARSPSVLGVAAGPAGRGRQRRPGRHEPAAPGPVTSQRRSWSGRRAVPGTRRSHPGRQRTAFTLVRLPLPSGSAAAASALAAGPGGRLLALTPPGCSVRAWRRTGMRRSASAPRQPGWAVPWADRSDRGGVRPVGAAAGYASHPGVTGSSWSPRFGWRHSAPPAAPALGRSVVQLTTTAPESGPRPRRWSRRSYAVVTAGRARAADRRGLARRDGQPWTTCPAARWADGSWSPPPPGPTARPGDRRLAAVPASSARQRFRYGGGLTALPALPAAAADLVGPGTSGHRAHRGRTTVTTGSSARPTPAVTRPKRPSRSLRLSGCRLARATSGSGTGVTPLAARRTVRAAWAPGAGPGGTARNRYFPSRRGRRAASQRGDGRDPSAAA